MNICIKYAKKLPSILKLEVAKPYHTLEITTGCAEKDHTTTVLYLYDLSLRTLYVSKIYENQSRMEKTFQSIDEEFYLEYLGMKAQYKEWCLKNDWPLPDANLHDK